MDELNQIQNPNVTPTVLPNQSMSTGPIKKKSPLLWIILAVVVAAAGLAWWYISQMEAEPVVFDQPKINKEAREDTMISKDVQEVDLGNLDAEFKAMDSDLNSL